MRFLLFIASLGFLVSVTNLLDSIDKPKMAQETKEVMAAVVFEHD